MVCEENLVKMMKEESKGSKDGRDVQAENMRRRLFVVLCGMCGVINQCLVKVIE